MKPYRKHEDFLNTKLKNPKIAASYLNAAAEENDPELILDALTQIAKVHGMSEMSKRAEMTRPGLYKSLSKNGNPELKTFLKLLKASGLQMVFKKAA